MLSIDSWSKADWWRRRYTLRTLEQERCLAWQRNGNTFEPNCLEVFAVKVDSYSIRSSVKPGEKGGSPGREMRSNAQTLPTSRLLSSQAPDGSNPLRGCRDDVEISKGDTEHINETPLELHPVRVLSLATSLFIAPWKLRSAKDRIHRKEKC